MQASRIKIIVPPLFLLGAVVCMAPDFIGRVVPYTLYIGFFLSILIISLRNTINFRFNSIELGLYFLVLFAFIKDVFLFSFGSIDQGFFLRDLVSVGFILSFSIWSKIDFFQRSFNFMLKIFLFFGFIISILLLFPIGLDKVILPNYPPAMMLPYFAMFFSEKNRSLSFLNKVWGAFIFCLIFVVSYLLEARAVFLALIICALILLVRKENRKYLSLFVQGSFILSGCLTFYIAIYFNENFFMNAVLTGRPAIWGHYLMAVYENNFLWGMGPVTSQFSESAANVVRELMGRAGPHYGPHSLFILAVFQYGFVGFIFSLALILALVRKYESEMWPLLISFLTLSLFASVYFGAPYLYGVIITISACAIGTSRASNDEGNINGF